MERRKFIQNSVIGSSGLIIGSSGILSASVLGTNEKIVLALIGAGNRGTGTIIVGNKQLFFDAKSERFIGNDEANKLLKSSYRDKYAIPESI